MTKRWTDLPPDLLTILRRYRDLGLSRFINISINVEGDFQVSVQDTENRSAWTCATNRDPLTALLEALGPGYGGSWAELLRTAEKEPDEPATADDDGDEDDDWQSVI